MPRNPEVLLDWALQVMRVHAERKAILEVEFLDEEGTGLGPTLEFFALVAAELQRKDLCMWVCEDSEDEVMAHPTDLNPLEGQVKSKSKLRCTTCSVRDRACLSHRRRKSSDQWVTMSAVSVACSQLRLLKTLPFAPACQSCSGSWEFS